MIKIYDDIIVLSTQHTTYALYIMPTGHLQHLYYGDKLIVTCREDLLPLIEKHAFAPGNTINYNEEETSWSLEDMCLEISGQGKGDLREPMIALTYADGNSTIDFLYDSYECPEEKPAMALPSAYGKADHLILHTFDRNTLCQLDLYYDIYEDCDVIAKHVVLRNTTDSPLIIERLMSQMLDFDRDDFILTTFNGAWAREMQKYTHVLTSGKQVNASNTLTSSSRANPFVMLSFADTTETHGACYGMNLIYSGNHYECAEVSSHHQTRFVQGINPEAFRYTLNAGESFETPEAIVTYSRHGFNDMSHHLHRFIQDCVVRGEWQYRERPILLNSWEAQYFDINELQLLRLARAAGKAGIELFVVDDGWFASRDDDTTSLGDWTPDQKKLPHGLAWLAEKIVKMGMMFGLWVEPEMISINSDLFRAHPDWVLSHPAYLHAMGRHQCLLDLCNPEVVDHIINTMSALLSSAEISYVKWDMNRIISDIYSPYLDSSQQGEVTHRYVLGLYKIMATLTQRFPHILFEGCASGGNRFDLGILSFFPQIWASDNTDALFRLTAQENYSYGYPLSTFSAHVSSVPNHQTMRITPLTTRFHVAMFGVLGYELNLHDLTDEERKEIKAEITLYKARRHLLQYGRFYRLPQTLHNWIVVSADQTQAIGMIMQTLAEANTQQHHFYAAGLLPEQRYHFTTRALAHNIKQFGGLINAVAPVHIKQDSLVHDAIARFMKMPGEQDDYTTTGNILMTGVKLAPAFSGTGYNDMVRFFPDFSSRLYIIDACSEKDR